MTIVGDGFSSRLVASVKRHEGLRLKPYRDSRGIWTIGYGTNLQAVEIDRKTAELWMYRALRRARDGISSLPGFSEAGIVRQDVLTECAYQIGVFGLMRFRKMWAAVAALDWQTAAVEMLDSKVARFQAPERWAVLAQRMASGKWEEDE
jgi:lysozyme